MSALQLLFHREQNVIQLNVFLAVPGQASARAIYEFYKLVTPHPDSACGVQMWTVLMAACVRVHSVSGFQVCDMRNETTLLNVVL